MGNELTPLNLQKTSAGLVGPITTSTTGSLSFSTLVLRAYSLGSHSKFMRIPCSFLGYVICSRTFWWVHGLVMIFFVAVGKFSFQRPAADIFAVGSAQAFPTIYLLFGCALHLASHCLLSQSGIGSTSGQPSLGRDEIRPSDVDSQTPVAAESKSPRLSVRRTASV